MAPNCGVWRTLLGSLRCEVGARRSVCSERVDRPDYETARALAREGTARVARDS